jgi:hypothetical protein
VLEAGFGEAAVACPAAADDGDCLADGGLGTGPAFVVVVPVLGGLVGAGAGDDVVELVGQEGELAAGASGGGAELACRAGAAGGEGELDGDDVGAAQAGGGPGGAGGALGAGNGAR